MKPEHIIERQGKKLVLYAGLIDEAHTHGLERIDTVLLQAPSDANGQTAIVHATAVTSAGSFDGIGDANPGNVAPNIRPHLIRMAETRAKARALRDAVNIGMVAFEEMGPDAGDELDDAAPARFEEHDRRDQQSRTQRSDAAPRASEAQVKAMFAIARNEAQLDRDTFVASVVARFGREPDDLDKRSASTVIDDLKAGTFTAARPQTQGSTALADRPATPAAPTPIRQADPAPGAPDAAVVRDVFRRKAAANPTTISRPQGRDLTDSVLKITGDADLLPRIIPYLLDDAEAEIGHLPVEGYRYLRDIGAGPLALPTYRALDAAAAAWVDDLLDARDLGDDEDPLAFLQQDDRSDEVPF